MKKRTLQFVCTYSVFIVNGMLALSIGSLLPFVREYLNLDYDFSGMIVSLHSVGNLIASFAAGALPSLIGRKRSILLFNSLISISFLILLSSTQKPLIAAVFFLTGMARGATSNFCNKMISELAPGKASMINGLHAMFAIGAFSFPLILIALTSTDPSNWIYACVFMLVMGLISFGLYVLMPIENDRVESQKKGGITGYAFFKEPLFYLCTLTMFFYLCAEQGVIGWMITYFKDTGLLPSALSQFTASVLWIMILAGRLTTAWASTRFPKERLLAVMGCGMVAFFVLLLMAKTTSVILIGIMGFGFSMSGIYPTTVSFTSRLTSKYTMAWSFMLTLASLGSILMPTVIGQIASTAGIASGMRSVALVIGIDLLFVIALGQYIKKHQEA
ncbi:MAG: MFS transporter [Erysipelotrichaceae bacterium]|nr:MFS transporter [Erysipelotrichaceae bacterium]